MPATLYLVFCVYWAEGLAVPRISTTYNLHSGSVVQGMWFGASWNRLQWSMAKSSQLRVLGFCRSDLIMSLLRFDSIRRRQF